LRGGRVPGLREHGGGSTTKVPPISDEEKKEALGYLKSSDLLKRIIDDFESVEHIGGHNQKKEFGAKMSIAYKECRETHYWLRLLRDSDFLSNDESVEVLADCEELCKIIGSIVRTSFSNEE